MINSVFGDRVQINPPENKTLRCVDCKHKCIEEDAYTHTVELIYCGKTGKSVDPTDTCTEAER